MALTRSLRSLGFHAGLLMIAAAFCGAAESGKNGSGDGSAATRPGVATEVTGLDAVTKDEAAGARSLDLLPLAFRRLSSLRSRDSQWHVTVDFFDEERVLVTFEGTEMMRRLRSCPKTHDDRIVHAVVVDVNSGAVLHRADWYLHDRRRYVWPLALGKMMVRRGDRLLEVDRDLNEKVLMDVADAFWIDVAPDGHQIVLGTATSSGGAKQGDKTQPVKYEVRALDASTLSLLGSFPLERPLPPKTTGKGYADVVLKGGWTWLVRFGGNGQPPLPITRVRSSCIPDLDLSGANTLLVGRCTTDQHRYVVSSFTTAGRFLWRQRWPQPLNSPVITRSASGARFALSNVVMAEGATPGAAKADEEPGADLRRQRIEVFNSATGTSVFKFETQPAVTVGGDVALSPEGTTLAVLRDARLELHRLPALEGDEVLKLAAVRADQALPFPPVGSAKLAEDTELTDEDDEAVNPAGTAAGAKSNPGPGTAGASVAPGMAKAISADDANGQAAEKSDVVVRSRVDAVVVDVVVTDSKGHPVTGLKPEDFTLSESGTGQKINFFEEHSVVDTQQTPAPQFQRAPNMFSNVSNTSQPDSSTLILFDTLNTPIQDQARARDALTRYIKHKPKNESFALCVLAGPLRLIRGFTTDENELLLGMMDKRAKPSASLISQLDTASLSFIRAVTQKLDNPNDIGRSFAIAMAGLERTIKDEQMSQDDMRTYMTIHAFGELARYMAGVPGRKKVLWLSAAFPLGTFAGESDGLDAGPFHQQRNFLALVSQTMNLLASAHVAVYPVDVRGVTTNSITDITEAMPFSQDLGNSPLSSPSGMGQQVQAGGGGLDASAAAAARNMANDHPAQVDGFVGRAQEDSVRRNSEHTAMDLVAEVTGGKAYYGSNDIVDAIRTTVDQGADYYTLSYTPSNRRYDGQFRKIKVQLTQRGYRLAHRSGYYANDPRGASAKLQDAPAGMMHGTPESRQISFEVQIEPVGEPKTLTAAEAGIRPEGKNAPTTVKLQHYSVGFTISPGPLRFEASPEGKFRGRFRLLANSFDSEGRPLLRAASTVVADLKPESYRNMFSQGLRFRQELDVPVDAGFLRLGVGDTFSSAIGTLELPLPIPLPKDDTLPQKGKALPPVEPE
jgi:VWFA-related protein